VAFYQAIQAELIGYQEMLTYQYEYQLTREPLRVDTLIILKKPELRIEKNIGRIFRRANIWEYKGPGDDLTVKDFYKVYAYGLLYAAMTPGIWAEDLTLTFVGERYPRGLVKYLKGEWGYKVEEEEEGIYQVKGDRIPIQIIETKKLNREGNRWLKELRRGLEVEEVRAILKEQEKVEGKTPLEAYYDAVLRANVKALWEAIQMGEDTMTLEEVLTKAGFLHKWWEQGRKTGREEVARNMLKKGFSPEEIAEITELDLSKLQTLAVGLN
jgi:hypothetical protein